jgi:hypothetical protein
MVYRSQRLPAADEAVQVRHTFSGGHCQQLTADGAAKENAEDVSSGLALRERLAQPHQGLFVPLNQLSYTRMQSTERLVVRR